MSPILYWPLLIFACGYAFYRGGRYERLVAAICIVGTLASVAVHPLQGRYVNVELGELMVDAAVLTAFVAIALHSDRFWPLWVAGLQLTSSFAHFLKAIQPDLIPHAYAAAVRFWSYPILIILLIGSWRSYRRRVEAEAHRPVAAT